MASCSLSLGLSMVISTSKIALLQGATDGVPHLRRPPAARDPRSHAWWDAGNRAHGAPGRSRGRSGLSRHAVRALHVAGRGYDVVQVLAWERSLRERSVSAGDRRALGPGGVGLDRTSGDAADRGGDTGRHRADVAARFQVLRSPRGNRFWSDHDPYWHRDLHSLEVQAVSPDLILGAQLAATHAHPASRS